TDSQLTVPSTPVVSVTAASCSSAAVVTVTNYVASGVTYTSSPAGLTVGAGGVVSGGVDGTSYTITATSTSAGSCPSTASSSFTNDTDSQLTVPSTPTIGTITQPTCTVTIGNFQIVGYNALNTYNFTPSVVSISSTGLVTGNPGTYTFTVENTAGCISLASSNVVINACNCTDAVVDITNTYVDVAVSGNVLTNDE
ncbi:hypothetical protein, partial [uncultured Tenacibaculum sp.]|uniref:hypothetical protein n=1 Tax=uncultured Tenacibaculum sp. TaxID=174713 RepID=UPI0026201BB3